MRRAVGCERRNESMKFAGFGICGADFVKLNNTINIDKFLKRFPAQTSGIYDMYLMEYLEYIKVMH